MRRPLVFLLASLLVVSSSVPAFAAAPATTKGAKTAVAVFAGGCFWCMETQFEGVAGVKRVLSGYTGGHKANPTYEEVCAHTTGHYEAIEIEFDPAIIRYDQLLERFWHGIDPTQSDGQFCDIAETYRSAIFWQDEAQRAAALASKRRLERSGVLKKPIVTEILQGRKFWPAEEYHQDFWKKDPVRYRSYREGCGRDRRLAQLWGKAATRPLVH